MSSDHNVPDPRADGLRSHVGVVVKDAGRTADFYSEAFGLGPFEPAELTGPGYRIRTLSAPLGRCEMELIEVMEGRPPHADFLDARGEGMNHFNLDYKDAEAYLQRMGHLQRMGIHNYWGYPHSGFCYVESWGIGGVTFEVMRGSGHAGKKGYNHLGLVVKDTDRTIGYYTGTLGLLPFRTNSFPCTQATYNGRRIDTAFKASFTEIGDCRLELMEVVEGETPHSRFLAERGEGMHHLRFEVDDLAARLDELAGKGVATTWTGPGLAYLDTTGIGGMVFAVSQQA